MQGAKAMDPQYSTVFTNAKAGMDGVDKEHVQRIVYEASLNSAHFYNEQRKQAAIDQRLGRMKNDAAALTTRKIAAFRREADVLVAEMEAGRDLTRVWLHCDMDMFFAAVELRDDPSLQGKPFVVGGVGMIATASYEARKYGVRSAMPGFIALRLCPKLVFVRANFENYKAVSLVTRAIFADYDPAFEAGSLDEAYLDVTDYCLQHRVSPAQVAQQIRERVQQDTQLTCSVGIAPNRMLAKICSDRHKPNGQFELPADREAILRFMQTLDVRKIPGVGRVTEYIVHNALGANVCGDLLEQRHMLVALFTSLQGEFLLRSALGLGQTRHSDPPGEGELGRKGMSCERTIKPTDDRSEQEAQLRLLAYRLAEDLAKESLRGRTLTLKLKESSFELRTRSTTLDRYISSAEDLIATGTRLLHAEPPMEVRLIGLRLSNFLEHRRDTGQPSLEELLQRHEQKQHADQQMEQQAEDEDAGLEQQQAQQQQKQQGQLEHSSQVVHAGELVELTLRDWQQDTANAGGNKVGARGGAPSSAAYSLPPSLAVSPTTARHFDQQMAAAADAAGAEVGNAGSSQVAAAMQAEACLHMHLPPTTLDRALRQAAAQQQQQQMGSGPRAEQGDQGRALPPLTMEERLQQLQKDIERNLQQDEQQPQNRQPEEHHRLPVKDDPRHIWACPDCTYHNSKLYGSCQMCGCVRPRPAVSTKPSARGKGGKKRKFSTTAAAPSAGKSATVRFFCLPGSSVGTRPQPGRSLTGTLPASAAGAGHQSHHRSSIMSYCVPAAAAAAGQNVQPQSQQQQQQLLHPHAHEQSGGKAAGMSAFAAGAAAAAGTAALGVLNYEVQSVSEAMATESVSGEDDRQHSADQQAQQQDEGVGYQQHKSLAPPAQAQAPASPPQQQQQRDPLPPESPLLDGEDHILCSQCEYFVRETRWQLHTDWHTAKNLQENENRMHQQADRLRQQQHTRRGRGRGRGRSSQSAQLGQGQRTLTALLQRNPGQS